MNETTDDSLKKIVNNLTNKYNTLKLNLKIYYDVENNRFIPHYDKESIKLIEENKFLSQYGWINNNNDKYETLIELIEEKLIIYPNNPDLQKLKEDALNMLLANFKQAQILFNNEYERRLLEQLPPPTNGGKNKKNKNKKGKSKKGKKGKKSKKGKSKKGKSKR